MITPEMIERINFLAHKKKNTGLTPEETDEQKHLYRIYIDNIKQQVRNSLEAVQPAPAEAVSEEAIPEHNHDCCCEHKHQS